MKSGNNAETKYDYRVHDIVWDTDGEGETVSLPSETTFGSDEELDDEEVADWLSDTYGYCVKGCSWDCVKGGKPRKRVKVEVDGETLSMWERMLEDGHADYDEEKIPEYATVWRATARFDDGYFADVKVNSNSRADGDFYAEAVLFDPEGRQVDYTDAEYSLKGVWGLGGPDADYEVEVAEKTVEGGSAG